MTAFELHARRLEMIGLKDTIQAFVHPLLLLTMLGGSHSVLAGDCEKTSRVLSFPGYHVQERIRLRRPVLGVAWSRDGSRLAVLNGWDAETFETRSWDRVTSTRVNQRLNFSGSIALLEGNKLLAGGDLNSENGPSGAHAMTLWAIDSRSVDHFLPATSDAAASFRPHDTFSVSSDERIAASTDIEGHELHIFDIAAGREDGLIKAPVRPRPTPLFQPVPDPNPQVEDRFHAITFESDDEHVAACAASGRLYVADVTSATIVATMPVFPEGVVCTAVAVGPDNESVAVGREAAHYKPLGRQPSQGENLALEDDVQNVRIVDVHEQSVLFTISTDPRSTVRGLAWGRDGCVLAVADDSSLSIWQQASRTRYFKLNQFDWPSRRVAFSSDGRLAVISGSDVLILGAEDRI